MRSWAACPRTMSASRCRPPAPLRSAGFSGTGACSLFGSVDCRQRCSATGYKRQDWFFRSAASASHSRRSSAVHFWTCTTATVFHLQRVAIACNSTAEATEDMSSSHRLCLFYIALCDLQRAASSRKPPAEAVKEHARRLSPGSPAQAAVRTQAAAKPPHVAAAHHKRRSSLLSDLAEDFSISLSDTRRQVRCFPRGSVRTRACRSRLCPSRSQEVHFVNAHLEARQHERADDTMRMCFVFCVGMLLNS